MHFINDGFDLLAIAVFLLSAWCFATLINRYRKYEDSWTRKTKDYWYSLLMWSVVGIALSVQFVLLDRPLTPAFVATTAAVLVTGKGLKQKGSWGGSDE